MDWTAVFHEDGEEELQFLIEETLNARAAPRLARLVSSVYVYSYHDHDHGRTKDKSSSSPQHAHEPSSLLKETKNVGKAKVYWGTNGNEYEYEYENAEGEDLSGHRLFELTRTLSQEEAEGGDSHGHGHDNANANANANAYTLWALYCLTINYILGVGCLGVPYAFARAGFILCGGIIIVVSGISYITVMWLAETGFFVEHMLENRPLYDDDDDEVEDLNRNINTDIHSSSVSVSEKTHLLRRKGRRRSRKIMDGDIDPLRYEVVDLVGFFVGRFHKVLYQISLLSLMCKWV